MPKDIEVGCCYFPNYYGGDERNSVSHGSGWCEWELFKAARPRFSGYHQPKRPVWGYEDEPKPSVIRHFKFYKFHVFIRICLFFYQFVQRKSISRLTNRHFHSSFTEHLMRPLLFLWLLENKGQTHFDQITRPITKFGTLTKNTEYF